MSSDSPGSCRWCGEPLPERPRGPGRRRLSCSARCKEALLERRRRLRARREHLLVWRAHYEASASKRGLKLWAKDRLREVDADLAAVEGELAALDAKVASR